MREGGRWDTLSCDAKSNIERAMKYAFQRGGSEHKITIDNISLVEATDPSSLVKVEK